MTISSSKIMSLVSMLLTILVALQFHDTQSAIYTKDVHVHVTSNITDLQLGLHCKDKHHDLGFQSLHLGETFTFSFRPKFLLENTLYFCGFSWMNEFHYFDIYVESRDTHKCKYDCSWKVYKSGPCLEKPNYEECFPWNPNVMEGRQLDLENNTLGV
uniref:S-protein homolog n=1 Tax=Cicer arietinum TaxID=3827 RepID=A0A3Q7XKB4_CICAR|nr:S-protein homolog 18-like [Cicer arietinum]